MVPRVLLKCASIEVNIANRSVGGLAGSRIAGLLGHYCRLRQILEPAQSQADRISVCKATWVDNLYAVLASLHGEITIVDDFEM